MIPLAKLFFAELSVAILVQLLKDLLSPRGGQLFVDTLTIDIKLFHFLLSLVHPKTNRSWALDILSLIEKEAIWII